MAGGGIVAASDPDLELAETQAKLQAMLSAIVRPDLREAAALRRALTLTVTRLREPAGPGRALSLTHPGLREGPVPRRAGRLTNVRLGEPSDAGRSLRLTKPMTPRHP